MAFFASNLIMLSLALGCMAQFPLQKATCPDHECSVDKECSAGGNGCQCVCSGNVGCGCRDVTNEVQPVAIGARYFHSPSVPVEPNNALCSPCVQLGGQSLNILLNEILNAGVVGGCSKLCGHLKSASSQKACGLVCDIVGIKEFIKALNHTDLDPIYFCEILHACPAGPDNAAVTLVSVAAQPASIAKGDTIDLTLDIDVTNASGVGEFGISVNGPVTQPVSQRFLLPKGIPVGKQTLAVKLTVQDDQSGDSPVVWSPGSYEFAFEVCQGECHSKHPHSKFFGNKASNFTLTEQDVVSV